VIRPNLDWFLMSLKVLAVFFQGTNDAKKLLVVDLVVALVFVERLRVESYRVPETICSLLFQNCARCKVRRIGF
jgi:hypothetical protein